LDRSAAFQCESNKALQGVIIVIIENVSRIKNVNLNLALVGSTLNATLARVGGALEIGLAAIHACSVSTRKELTNIRDFLKANQTNLVNVNSAAAFYLNIKRRGLLFFDIFL